MDNNVMTLPFNVMSVLILVLSVIYLLKKYATKSDFRLPPGPICLPFIGTIPFHGFGPSDFQKLHSKYGDIFTIYAGSNRVIVLNSFDLVTEAYATKYQAFSARGCPWTIMQLNPKKAGLVCADFAPEFQQRRTKSINMLRHLGFGKSTTESKIQYENNLLTELFESKNGEAFNPCGIINNFVANIMFGVLYNERIDNESALKLVDSVDKFFKTGLEMVILDFFPILRFVPYLKKHWNNERETHDFIMEHLRTKINEHMESHTPGQDSDFVHAFIDSCIDEESNELDMDHFEFIVRDFVLAGLETTSTTINWLVILLANNVEAQRKAREEIEATVGNRAVSITDRDQLHFTEAIIQECMRYKTVAPYGLQHCAAYNSTISGYHIPAGTQLIGVLSHVHMDKATWGDPEVFRPERFIDDEGRFVRHSHVIPFSTGKRQCLGEMLARQELFLFTASVLQHFKLMPPEGVDTICEDEHQGFTHSPNPYQIRAIAI